MRIRSTKPEFWRSKRIASVPWDTRLVLKALESYVDDNGVGENDVATICGDCFLHDLANPRETSRTLARVSEAISELSQAGLLWLYESNGRELLYISFWEDVQRIDKPQSGRNPRPDGTFNYKESVIRESVATPREHSRTFAPGTGEQGNRGTGEEKNMFTGDADERELDFADEPFELDIEPKPNLDDLFSQAWNHWPKKQKKKDALKKFKQHAASVGAVELRDRIITFGDAYKVTTAKQFIPALDAWLNQERWEDELPLATAVKYARGDDDSWMQG